MESNMMFRLKNRNYSFRKRLSQILRLLLVFQIAGFILYSLFFNYFIRNRAYSEIRQTLELYNNEISTNLKSVDYYIVEINHYSSDISLVGAASNVQDKYDSIARINQLFEYNLRSFPNIQGLYAYFPKNGTWIANRKDSFQSTDFETYLRGELSHTDMNILAKKSSMSWILYRFNGKSYFVNFFKLGDSIVGAWTDADTLSSTLTDLLNRNGKILFVDRYGSPLPGTADADMPDISVDKTLNEYDIIAHNHTKYLTVSSALDYCNDYITAMVPLSQVDVSRMTVLRAVGLMIMITLGIFLLIDRLMSRFLSESVSTLESVTNSIANGQTESRIDTSSQRCTEILEISESYNHMIDTVQKLKIDVYEENLQKKNVEMQYLKSQVAPHFLINCLNLISYMADGTSEHTSLIRRMITTLSDHLRYTLSTNDRVPLEKELTYVENYIELTKLRFPDCITYQPEIDSQARNAVVFPLILLMITENTFKHNLVMGEPLTVIIRAQVTGQENARRLHLTHIDSGDGYPEEILQNYQNEDRHSADLSAGKHIGIYNLVKRIKLYYDDSARLQLSNAPGMGACTEIDIPYIAYEPVHPIDKQAE